MYQHDTDYRNKDGQFIALLIANTENKIYQFCNVGLLHPLLYIFPDVYINLAYPHINIQSTTDSTYENKDLQLECALNILKKG